MTALLIDAGNSRLKWASSAAAGRLLQTGTLELAAGQPAAVLQAIAVDWLNLEAVHVANVRGPGFQTLLQDWITQQHNLPTIFHRTPARGWSVLNGYTKPEQLGIDRWAALVAARRLCASSLCVIDCGTAVTIDVLNAQGRHLGGMISPGLKIMQEALRQGTAGLKVDVTAGIEASRLAQDTARGIIAGTTNAVLGLIERHHRLMQTTVPDMQTFLTGGAAESMAPLLGDALRHEPHLVLQGLSIMAMDAP
jgi:type III pantothenate kinase